MNSEDSQYRIAVVVPCYRVKRQILSVLDAIGPEVSQIFVIDDCCPEESGKFVAERTRDARVTVIRNRENRGVGGATITGYRAALEAGADIIVKVDGDGQMDPRLIPAFVDPIVRGDADYTKGNRFFSLEFLDSMPRLRLLGNSLVSFISKVASGYWNVMDPANGFTAIHARVLEMIPLTKVEERYFFESDMLFRLNILRAVVADIPMPAHYADERSNLRIGKVLVVFPQKYVMRLIKRIFYNYFLRDFNLCSVELLTGLLLFLGGLGFGAQHWYHSAGSSVPTPAGTVMLAVLPVMLGFQLLLSAVSYDVMNVPRAVLHRSLSGRIARAGAVHLQRVEASFASNQ